MHAVFENTAKVLHDSGLRGQARKAAEVLRISTAEVSRHLNGKRVASLYDALAYADMFGADINEVIRGFVVDYLRSMLVEPAPAGRTVHEQVAMCGGQMNAQPADALPLVAQLVVAPFGEPDHIAVASYLMGNLLSYQGDARKALIFWEAAIESDLLPDALATNALCSRGKEEIALGMYAEGRNTLQRALDRGDLLPHQEAYANHFLADAIICERPTEVTASEVGAARAHAERAYQLFSADPARQPRAELSRALIGCCEVLEGSLKKRSDQMFGGIATLHKVLKLSEGTTMEWTSIHSMVLRFWAIAHAFAFGSEALSHVDELEAMAVEQRFPLMRREARRLRRVLPKLWAVCLFGLLALAPLAQRAEAFPCERTTGRTELRQAANETGTPSDVDEAAFRRAMPCE
jgi:tetratricopeptide (TPR) repeat protein